MAMLDQVPTLPARFGVERAMYRGRYGIETVSYTAPLPDPRAHAAKRVGSLKQHKAGVHDVGVTLHRCDHPGCDYASKQASHLKQHKADIHDIDVNWHVCDVSGCSYRSKQASHLTDHTKTQHNDTYVARQKKQEERVRLALVTAGYK